MPDEFGGIPVKPQTDEFGGVPVAKAPIPQGQPSKPTATIGATPRGNNILQRAGDYVGDLTNDIRKGTTLTAPGRVLAKLGAKGTDTGNSPAVGEFMASPVIGPSRVAQGLAQVASPRSGGEMREGAGNVAGGALQTAQIPLSMVGPEASATALSRVGEMIPSTARAGQNFERVMQGARNIPIDTSAAGNAALRAQELAGRGTSLPKVAKDFIRRSTEPGTPPINYEEGRDFASNAGLLSVRDSMKANSAMKRQVSTLARALDTANEGAADQAGLGNEYRSAMKEYRQVQRMKTAGKAVGGAVLTGVGADAAYKLAQRALGSR